MNKDDIYLARQAVRGGFWSATLMGLRSAYRSWANPKQGCYSISLRLALRRRQHERRK